MPALSTENIELIKRTVYSSLNGTSNAAEEQQKSSSDDYYCDQYGNCQVRRTHHRHRHLGFLGFLAFVLVPIAALIYFCYRKKKNNTTTTYSDPQVADNNNYGSSEGYYDQNGNFVPHNANTQQHNAGAGYPYSGKTQSSSGSSSLNHHTEKNQYTRPDGTPGVGTTGVGATGTGATYTGNTTNADYGHGYSNTNEQVGAMQYERPIAAQHPQNVTTGAQDYYNTPVANQGYYKT